MTGFVKLNRTLLLILAAVFVALIFVVRSQKQNRNVVQIQVQESVELVSSKPKIKVAHAPAMMREPASVLPEEDAPIIKAQVDAETREAMLNKKRVSKLTPAQRQLLDTLSPDVETRRRQLTLLIDENLLPSRNRDLMKPFVGPIARYVYRNIYEPSGNKLPPYDDIKGVESAANGTGADTTEPAVKAEPKKLELMVFFTESAKKWAGGYPEVIDEIETEIVPIAKKYCEVVHCDQIAISIGTKPVSVKSGNSSLEFATRTHDAVYILDGKWQRSFIQYGP